MNDDIVIDVKHISKKYTIATDYQPDTLREKIVELAKYPFKVIKGEHQKPKTKEYWALKDVSFQVKRGEVLGIIGKNGAGKSTLLKILSRTTEPTSGTITMKGKVASLLEVGTGFNPELTGRENIYLNGAIIGMSRNEINSKFNEIVEFAGIGEFLDTPVKRYSSGMYVRLAFAVAAHLDSDILLLDEVLAVGDSEFQRKCIGKMSDLSKSGRTVIFISHNLESIRRVCSKAIIIEKGKIFSLNNDVEDAVAIYIKAQRSMHYEYKSITEVTQFHKNEYFTPKRFYIYPNKNKYYSRFDNLEVVIEGNISKRRSDLTIGYALYTEDDRCLYWSYPSDNHEKNSLDKPSCKVSMRSSLPLNILNNGRYRIELIGGINNIEWIFPPANSKYTLFFEIRGKVSKSTMWTTDRPTIISPILHWDVKYD
ncbi:MAG: ABC transporter ATP-binding protein [Candidatus Microgenomates bacterium]